VEGVSSSDFVRSIERPASEGPTILVVGTLDTKGKEIGFVADAIVEAGGAPVLLDSSVANGTAASDHPLISRADVARASGSTIEAVSELPRGEAVAKMQAGVRELTVAMVSAGRVQAAICIGGAGAHLVGPAFRALEIGFPKMVVSPLASGQRQFEPYVGLRDVVVMHSVADIVGINDITEKVFRTAAGYIVGAAQSYVRGGKAGEGERASVPTVVISMNGNTTKAMDRGRAWLEREGFAVVVFHANGVGGRALEDFVGSGHATAVLDFTTTELGAGTVGGLMNAGPTRMETAGKSGVPQVLVPGCVDFITCGPWEQAAAEFPNRTMFRHNPELTLVRLGSAEMAELGAVFARKANLAVGPTSILVPTRGFSVPDVEGGHFWDPAADQAFVDALRENLREDIHLKILDAHINDDSFADAAVETLLDQLGSFAGPRVGAGHADPAGGPAVQQ